MKERMTAIVGARISEFKRKMAEVNTIAKRTAREVVVNVKVRYKKSQERLDKIADTIRTLQTVGTNMVFGSLLAISPGAVPTLAVAIGALATLGPMIGVVAGSTFALATAFGFAGAAALAFGGVAVPTISKLFEENAKLNKQQKAAKQEFEKMKKTWQSLTKELEKPVLEAFSKSMRIANKVLKMAEPLFHSAAKAVNNLLDSLNASLGSAPVKAFFDYMNKQGGPMLETLGKAFGNFVKGFLSMMVAFGPLAEKTAQGFLSMSKRFSEWAAGLSKSEKFQSFVKFIQDNMPKIRAIFRDATAGILYMFSAFGPLSSDMMSGLKNMMAGFKEWAKGLSKNESFQKFIGYIRDNAPKVISLIGNLTDFIINLAVGMAPLGSKILDVVNGFLEWVNGMMKSNSWVGKLVGWVIVLSGVFQALYPILTVALTMFSGFGAAISRGIIKMGPSLMKFIKFAGKGLARLGLIALRFGARMAMSFLIAIGPIGWIIAAVVALVALIIWKWDEVKKWTKKAWEATKKFLISAWESIVSSVSKVWGKITEFFSNLWEGIKKKAATAWQAIKSAVMVVLNPFIAGIMNIFNGIKGGISLVWEGIKKYFTAVWTIIKNIFVGALLLILDLVTGNFDALKSDALAIWNNIKTALGQVWEAIKMIFSGALAIVKGYMSATWENLKSVTSTIWNAIKSFFSKIWEGIKAIFWTVIGAIVSFAKTRWENLKRNTKAVFEGVKSLISTIWNAIKTFFTETLVNIWRNTKQKFEDIKNSVRDKMNDLKDKIKEIWNTVMDFLKGIDLKDIGKNMIQGLINGVGSMAKSLVKKVKGVIGDATEAARNLLGIHSPSRVFMEIGEFTGKGLAIGMSDTIRMVTNQAKELARATLPNEMSIMPSMAGTPLPSTATNHNRSSGAEDSISRVFDNVMLEAHFEIDGETIVKATGKPMLRYMGQETKKASRRTGGGNA